MYLIIEDARTEQAWLGMEQDSQGAAPTQALKGIDCVQQNYPAKTPLKTSLTGLDFFTLMC